MVALPMIDLLDRAWQFNPLGRQAENRRRWEQNQANLRQAGTSQQSYALRNKYMGEYQTAYNEAKAANLAFPCLWPSHAAPPSLHLGFLSPPPTASRWLAIGTWN